MQQLYEVENQNTDRNSKLQTADIGTSFYF